LKREKEKLTRKLQKSDEIIILGSDGKKYSSEEFAELLKALKTAASNKRHS